jgi:hypothetical protein
MDEHALLQQDLLSILNKINNIPGIKMHFGAALATLKKVLVGHQNEAELYPILQGLKERISIRIPSNEARVQQVTGFGLFDKTFQKNLEARLDAYNQLHTGLQEMLDCLDKKKSSLESTSTGSRSSAASK